MLWRDRAGQVRRSAGKMLTCKVGASRQGTAYWHLASTGLACAQNASPGLRRRGEVRPGLFCKGSKPSAVSTQRTSCPLLDLWHPPCRCVQRMPVGTEAPCVRAGRVTLSWWHKLPKPSAHRAQSLVHDHLLSFPGQGRSSVEEAKPQAPSCSLQPADYSVSRCTS